MVQLGGSITALATPFKNGAVDEKAFERFVDWQIREGTNALVVCGTTGESPTLSDAEQERLMRLTVEVAKGRVPVVAGTGSCDTADAIMRTQMAARVGADAALIVTPYYNKPTQEGLYQHFKAIHDATDIPIVLYNIPARCVVDIKPETMKRLAQLPRIVGVKDATGDLTRPPVTARDCGPAFTQLSGDDGNAIALLEMGGKGCISVASNVAPRLCADMQAAWQAGDQDRARAINAALMPLYAALFVETSPSPVKYALSLLGLMGDDVRLPLVTCSAATKAQMESVLEALELTRAAAA